MSFIPVSLKVWEQFLEPLVKQTFLIWHCHWLNSFLDVFAVLIRSVLPRCLFFTCFYFTDDQSYFFLQIE